MENLVQIADGDYFKLVSITDIASIMRTRHNVGGSRWVLEVTYKGGAEVLLNEDEAHLFWKAVSNKGMELLP